MKKTLTTLGVTAALLVPATAAQAQPVLDEPWEGCGPGYIEDGVRCILVQQGPPNPRIEDDDWWHGVVFAAFGAVMLVGSMVP